MKTRPADNRVKRSPYGRYNGKGISGMTSCILDSDLLKRAKKEIQISCSREDNAYCH
jgi:hypothetical protein